MVGNAGEKKQLTAEHRGHIGKACHSGTQEPLGSVSEYHVPSLPAATCVVSPTYDLGFFDLK